MRSACFDNAVQNILGNFDKSQNLGFKIQYFSFSQDLVKMSIQITQVKLFL